jgi:hypothetical protein
VGLKESYILARRPDLLNSESVKVLDFGGSTGKYCPFLNHPNSQVYVLDASKSELHQNTKRYDSDDQLLFDLIVVSHVLEHIVDMRDLLMWLRGKCNESGVVYIEVPFERVMHEEVDDLNPNSPDCLKRYWHEHINFFSVSSLKHLLKRSGWSLIDLSIVRQEAPGNFDKIIQILAQDSRESLI